jgi:hypothetical protein
MSLPNLPVKYGGLCVALPATRVRTSMACTERKSASAWYCAAVDTLQGTAKRAKGKSKGDRVERFLEHYGLNAVRLHPLLAEDFAKSFELSIMRDWDGGRLWEFAASSIASRAAPSSGPVRDALNTLAQHWSVLSVSRSGPSSGRGQVDCKPELRALLAK